MVLDDLLLARRLRSWLRKQPNGARAYLVDSDVDPCAENWAESYAYRVALPGAVGNTAWMDGSDDLSLLVGGATVHVCEGLNPPSERFDLADPAAEDALAWRLRDTYGLDVPYGWLLPRSESRPARARAR
jgi:hypothetical protein